MEGSNLGIRLASSSLPSLLTPRRRAPLIARSLARAICNSLHLNEGIMIKYYFPQDCFPRS